MQEVWGFRPSEETLRERPHVAIAGASGRIGRAFQETAINTYEITSLRHKADIPHPEYAKEVVEDFDVTHRGKVQRTVERLARNGVATLINSTGVVNVDACERERSDQKGPTYQVHVVGAENLAIACRENGVKLLHLSTEYVFDGRKPLGEKYTEDDTPDTDIASAPTWYGLTKALGEQRILETYPEGSAIARISQVQGLGGGLFLATLRALDKGAMFTRANNQLVSPITDASVVTAISKIERALRGGTNHQIYHISSTDASTSYQTSLMLAETYGLGELARQLITPVTLEYLVQSGEQKVVRPKNSVLSVEGFERDFGKGILGSVSEEINRFKSLYGKPA